MKIKRIAKKIFDEQRQLFWENLQKVLKWAKSNKSNVFKHLSLIKAQ